MRRIRFLKENSHFCYTDTQLEMFLSVEKIVKKLINLLLKENMLRVRRPIGAQALDQIDKLLSEMRVIEMHAFESYFKTNESIFGV